ncbi:MAG TPA: helix-turn-helix domain-containing protein [Steroidobacteraceae bacterium]
MEAGGQNSSDFTGTSPLKLDEWAALLSSTCGGDHLVVDPDAFSGWMRRLSVYGLPAAEVKVHCGGPEVDRGDYFYRYERTPRAVRLAGADWYCVLFQVTGRSVLTQNDHTVKLGVGDISLVDGAKPSTRLSESGAQWLSIYLPRQPLISHLGFEPQTCLYERGETAAARVLRQLVLEGIENLETPAARSCAHMRLALHDLLGAVFAPSVSWPGSRHSDKLFARIRRIMGDRFADPNFGPNDVAAETGISLRYLQKLFTERGSTCSELIFALRLDYAARLVRRRTSLGTRQPLSEIAYACGFRDYTHFARKFRHRFGHAPGAQLDTGESTRSASQGGHNRLALKGS